MISCNDITYRDYVKIMTDQFAQVKELSGFTELECISIKEHLAVEFQALVGDHTYSNYMSLVDKYDKLELKRLKCSGLVGLLSVYSVHNAEVVALLANINIQVDANDTNEGILLRVHATMQKCVIQQRSIEVELKALQATSDSKDSVSEADLLKVIAKVSIGLMFGVSVLENATVVAGYISILNKQQEKENGKKR